MTGQTATGGSVRSRRGIGIGGSTAGWTPIVVFAAAAAGVLLLAVGSASAQTITSKRAQAEAIMAEVESLNGNLEQTIESYNYANVQLQKVESDLASMKVGQTAKIAIAAVDADVTGKVTAARTANRSIAIVIFVAVRVW